MWRAPDNSDHSVSTAARLATWGPRFLVLGAVAAVVTLQAPLIAADPLLARDDRRLVEPLARLESVADYAGALRDGRVLDRQPVRDASFVLNLWLQRGTGHGLFHLSNVVLWIGCVLLSWRLFASCTPSPWVAASVTALFAIHPALGMSVAWVAARKHLLSCFFILVATLAFRRATRRGLTGRGALGIVGWYTLSVFAQPINLLWPVWVTWSLSRGKTQRAPGISRWSLIAPLCAVATFCGWANASYYAGAFVADSGRPKFVEGVHVGVSLLALGRAFFNLACPVSLATTYDPGRVLNLVGLGLLVPFGLWVWKRVPRPEAAAWGLFALLPLTVVLGRMTAIFLFDSYLLTPAVGLGCLVAHLVPHGAAARRAMVPAALLAVLFALQTARVVGAWTSDERLWAHALANEPTPNALAKQAYYLAGSHEAVELGEKLREVAPEHPEADYVFARAVALDRGLTVSQRLELLSRKPSGDPWYRYFEATVLASAGEERRAAALMSRALETPRAFRQELGIIAAEAVYLCERAGEPDCEQRIGPLKAERTWSQAAFERRRAALASSVRHPPP